MSARTAVCGRLPADPRPLETKMGNPMVSESGFLGRLALEADLETKTGNPMISE